MFPKPQVSYLNGNDLILRINGWIGFHSFLKEMATWLSKKKKENSNYRSISLKLFMFCFSFFVLEWAWVSSESSKFLVSSQDEVILPIGTCLFPELSGHSQKFLQAVHQILPREEQQRTFSEWISAKDSRGTTWSLSVIYLP